MTPYIDPRAVSALNSYWYIPPEIKLFSTIDPPAKIYYSLDQNITPDETSNLFTDKLILTESDLDNGEFNIQSVAYFEIDGNIITNNPSIISNVEKYIYNLTNAENNGFKSPDRLESDEQR